MQQSQQPDDKSGTRQRRVSLSKHREQIEQWVAQERSDEWIANALGTSRSSVQSFRSRADIRRSRRGRPQKNAPAKTTSGGGKQADDDSSASDNDDGVSSVFEGVLDQGEEGYGLWLDPAVADDPAFRESFAGVSDIRVLIQPGRIVLEPASKPDTDRDAASDSPQTESAPADGDGSGPGTVDTTVPGPASSDSATAASGEPAQVKFFDANKGFGFLVRPDGEEIFFHRSEIENGVELEAGEFVVYEPGMSQRGPAAKRVRTVG